MEFELLETAVYFVGGLILLLVGKIFHDVITPHDDNEELTKKDNAAFGLSLAGYYIAIPIIFAGAIYTDAPAAPDIKTLFTELGISLAYGGLGIVCLNIGRFILDRVVMPGFSIRKEILTDRNAGAGAVIFGSYLATGLAIAGAVNGGGGGPLTALAFWGLAQVAVIIFVRIYQLVTPYNLFTQIEKDNVAAGVAFGLNLVALGMVCGKASAGDFISWDSNLTTFGTTIGAGLLLIILVRFVADRILLPKASLSKEIATDQNLGAAFVEGAAAIGIASVMVAVL